MKRSAASMQFVPAPKEEVTKFLFLTNVGLRAFNTDSPLHVSEVLCAGLQDICGVTPIEVHVSRDTCIVEFSEAAEATLVQEVLQKEPDVLLGRKVTTRYSILKPEGRPQTCPRAALSLLQRPYPT